MGPKGDALPRPENLASGASGASRALPSRAPARAVLVVLAVLVTGPGTSLAAEAGQGEVRSGPLLFALAVLVVAAKVGGLVAEACRQPPVLGELLVGIGLGNLAPWVLGGQGVHFVGANPALAFLAEIGVLVLLFEIGLEADLRALARVGLSSGLVATIGVAIPIALGWAGAAWLLPDSPWLVHVFLGATLSATSVAITARVLTDLGAVQSREGQIILGAALLDDVLGLVVLAVVSGMATGSAVGAAGVTAASIAGIVARAVLFLGATVVLGHYLAGPIVRLTARTGHPEAMLVVGLALCFTLAYAAELVGLADIVGAFAAGLLLDPYGRGVRTREQDATLAELLRPIRALLVPLFFVLVGIHVEVDSLLMPATLALASVLTVIAIVSKLAAALGVVTRGVRRLAVGVGMVPRGEVGLIFAGIGTRLAVDGQPLLSQMEYSAVVLMVLVTTLVGPAALGWTLSPRDRH